MRDEASQQAAVARALSAWGRMDILVAAAGVASGGPVHLLPVEEWQRVIDVNLTAHFVCAQCVIPGMIARGGGVIVNMSSVAGRIGQPNRSPYVASKWGVRGLTATLARELAPHNIRCNAILPGSVRGARIERVIKAYAEKNRISITDAEKHYLQRQASRAYVEPEEIAETILRAVGPYAMTNDPDWGPLAGLLEHYQRSAVVGLHPGGTTDIQKVIMARRIGIGRTTREQAGRLR